MIRHDNTTTRHDTTLKHLILISPPPGDGIPREDLPSLGWIHSNLCTAWFEDGWKLYNFVCVDFGLEMLVMFYILNKAMGYLGRYSYVRYPLIQGAPFLRKLP